MHHPRTAGQRGGRDAGGVPRPRATHRRGRRGRRGLQPSPRLSDRASRTSTRSPRTRSPRTPRTPRRRRCTCRGARARASTRRACPPRRTSASGRGTRDRGRRARRARGEEVDTRWTAAAPAAHAPPSTPPSTKTRTSPWLPGRRVRSRDVLGRGRDGDGSARRGPRGDGRPTAAALSRAGTDPRRVRSRHGGVSGIRARARSCRGCCGRRELAQGARCARGDPGRDSDGGGSGVGEGGSGSRRILHGGLGASFVRVRQSRVHADDPPQARVRARRVHASQARAEREDPGNSARVVPERQRTGNRAGAVLHARVLDPGAPAAVRQRRAPDDRARQEGYRDSREFVPPSYTPGFVIPGWHETTACAVPVCVAPCQDAPVVEPEIVAR